MKTRLTIKERIKEMEQRKNCKNCGCGLLWDNIKQAYYCPHCEFNK